MTLNEKPQNYKVGDLIEGYNVGPPFRESTVLTVPVPESVAGMHRRREMVQKACRYIHYKT